ncbi:phosphatidylinositol 4-phosphate 3-kinase C2 domain-containing subunit gamma [Otolemur garnettii]|uniref:phosphatidylinositol 4-phosphate 3-kinase C2 domain-containing subunit gamma n=1 Tax=Otolemur garnettii TaxID=30611 RepID=UPI000C7EA091|nr:phosphatidylinositol 4-phosphate 3-kinase C2 domain-containing subunit gamma [Otolemur garnettii]
MAYYWQTDPNPDESDEKQYEHQEFRSVQQPLSSSQVSLGFDQLVVEISDKTPLYERGIEENTFSVSAAPTMDSESHSLDETHHSSLNTFTSKSPELCWHQGTKTPVIGFRPSVLPQNVTKECSWENPRGEYPGSDDSRTFNLLAPSPTSLDKINRQRQLENENYNYHIGFESSFPPTHSSFSMDFMSKEEKRRHGHMKIGEPSSLSLPRIQESAGPKYAEPIGCSIQLIEVPEGSNMSLASFCDKVKKIREAYHATEINANSGKIWSTVTTFPHQLFPNTRFNINVFTDTSTQPLHFMPYANCLVKDLIAEIRHFCTNDHMFLKDYILSVCGSEEFLQNDHCLGSHKMFQKDKSVIQLRLQKNRESLGKLSRKHEDDHSQFYLNQLLEFMHIWKVSRQCLLTLIKKYDFCLKNLLKTQENVDNIIEEVKNFYRNPETPAKGLIEKVTTELSTSIHQLINVYCSSFYADFQPVNVPESTFCANPGLHSHLSFTVYAAHNVPETWVYRINFPLEIKSLPKESMLTIKLYGIACETNNAKLLAWTCLPLFSKEKSILGSMLFSMTLQSEPPREMIAPGVWDVSQPSPVTLQMRIYVAKGMTKKSREHVSGASSLSLGVHHSDELLEDDVSGRKAIYQEIRKVAVGQLDRLLNDELLEYLPQLVQAVKFEWNLESPLVQLLLHRSLQSIQIAHSLYWLLNNAQNEVYFKSWYQKLLAALQFCAGKALSDEFSKEKKLIKILGDIGQKVKSASDHQRQEVLKKEIDRLEEFFQDGNTCHLPLNPALCVKGIDHDACSYFTSNALPLKITFINANPVGRNISIIFKAGDDLRQDMLVLQIIQVMDNIWLQEGLDMQMIIYRCLSTGKDQGLVQMVPDAVTLAKIHRHSGLIGPLKENTIKKWFSQHNHLKADYEKALRNFFYSCAGWCVVTFILGVCDRHNDNIMLTKSGHMFHIDFGKFLGHAQTFGGIKRDRAPFIFTSEMEYFITEGGKNPQHFQDFVELCCQAYNIVRKHSRLLLNLLEMMLHAGLPELSGIQDLKYVYNTLRPQDTDLEATSHFTRKIKESLECFPVKLNNLIHTLAQMSTISPAKPTSQTFPQESCLLSTARSIQRATILGFSKKPTNLYLIQVTQSNHETSLTEKSLDQFSRLHSQLQKQFPSLTLPEFPHWWHLPFTNSDHKRFSDLNHYMEQILNGSHEVANSDCILNFFLSEPIQQTIIESSLVHLCETLSDKKPQVQLVMSHEDTKLTILVKHMKNIHLPDGSAPSAHVEFYLFPYPSEVRRRKTKSVPKCTDPTYNEIVVYDEVTELQGHVLMLVVKSKTVFVGAINIQLCSVVLNEEKWYPLGNSII